MCDLSFFFFFKQKTAYEIYQCDWSSDVCSSDLISSEDLPHVFDRFYRSQGAAREAGLGLGLAISRELAQAMGGDISARSRPGEGSGFTLTLPLSPGG